MATLETRMADAYQAGRAALASGKKPADNPHDSNAAKASERVLAKMWHRGFRDSLDEAIPSPTPAELAATE